MVWCSGTSNDDDDDDDHNNNNNNNNNNTKIITRTCSQALSMNRRRGQSLGGLTVCINC